MIHYSLGDFININNNSNFKLPQETVDIISQLSEQVSSPSYVRTPVFNKKEFNFKNQVGTTITQDTKKIQLRSVFIKNISPSLYSISDDSSIYTSCSLSFSFID